MVDLYANMKIMDNTQQFQAIQKHINTDAFANHLGAKLEALEEGYSRYSLTVQPEHLNFHGSVHGGIIFSLGDIAFAAAGNSRGQMAVALNVDIGFMRPAQVGDTLVAEAKEISLSGPIGLYELTVRCNGELIAQSQATIYRKKEYFVEQPSRSG